MEKKAFAEILSDVDDDYAVSLEQMALKKSANAHVFDEIAQKLYDKINEEDFIIENSRRSFKGKEYPRLDLSVKKLRDQFIEFIRY